jgi:hypothetical protein
MADTQRVDVARLAELYVKINEGLNRKDWEDAAHEIVCALPALLLQVAELDAEIERARVLLATRVEASRLDEAIDRAHAAERAREESEGLLRRIQMQAHRIDNGEAKYDEMAYGGISLATMKNLDAFLAANDSRGQMGERGKE